LNTRGRGKEKIYFGFLKVKMGVYNEKYENERFHIFELAFSFFVLNQ